MRAKYPSTTSEDRVLDITYTRGTGTFLTFQLTTAAGNGIPFLGAMCTLAFAGHDLPGVKPDGVIVRLDSEDLLVQFDLAGTFLSV